MRADHAPQFCRGIMTAELEPTARTPGMDPEPGRVVLLPMHLVKGLEFRAVVVACCDEEVLPLQSRIEAVSDDSDLEEVYNTDRHLLYVASTRARDHLLVTGVVPGSAFVGDLGVSRHSDLESGNRQEYSPGGGE